MHGQVGHTRASISKNYCFYLLFEITHLGSMGLISELVFYNHQSHCCTYDSKLR